MLKEPYSREKVDSAEKDLKNARDTFRDAPPLVEGDPRTYLDQYHRDLVDAENKLKALMDQAHTEAEAIHEALLDLDLVSVDDAFIEDAQRRRGLSLIFERSIHGRLRDLRLKLLKAGELHGSLKDDIEHIVPIARDAFRGL